MGINPNLIVETTYRVSFYLFFERRGRLTVLGQILVAMPRTGDAAVDNFALAERAVLVATQIAYCRKLTLIAEDRNIFAVDEQGFCPIFGYVVHRTD